MSTESTFKGMPLKAKTFMWRKRLLQSWPFFVWLGAVLVTTYLYANTQRVSGMIGAVEAIVEPVAPVEAARLIDLQVVVGQKVKTGDVLAHMDPYLVNAELQVAEAELEEARTTITGSQQDILQLARQFDAAVHDSEVALGTEQMNQKRDQAELAELNLELQRLEALVADGLIGRQDVNMLRSQVVALERAVEAYPGLIATHQRRVSQALEQRKELDTWLRLRSGQETLADAIQRKTEVENKILLASKELLDLKKRSYALRATRDGIVSRIFHVEGTVVAAGEPIMRVVAEKAERVQGFLPETQIAALRTGDQVVVWRRTGRGRKIPAVVESISPEIDALPGRVTPLGGQTLRGRRVIVKLQGEHDLTPGETVLIRPTLIGWRALLTRRQSSEGNG